MIAAETVQLQLSAAALIAIAAGSCATLGNSRSTCLNRLTM
jgi:hypothetical protein